MTRRRADAVKLSKRNWKTSQFHIEMNIIKVSNNCFSNSKLILLWNQLSNLTVGFKKRETEQNKIKIKWKIWNYKFETLNFQFTRMESMSIPPFTVYHEWNYMEKKRLCTQCVYIYIYLLIATQSFHWQTASHAVGQWTFDCTMHCTHTTFAIAI